MVVLRTAVLLLLLPRAAFGWGSSSSASFYDYGESLSRDWLNDGSKISLKLEGCVWGNVYDNEESGCLADSSEDGTSSWYMMSNCRRAQAAFSLYASSSSGNCNSANFKESFVTTVGLSEFIGWLKDWDSYSVFNNDNNNNNNNGWDVDELPECEEGGNGYIGLGCNDDGTFSINYYSDGYCQISTGVYDKLNNLNYMLKSYKSCVGLDSPDEGEEHEGEDGGGDGSLASNLIYYASSCSSLDSSLCTDDSGMSSRRSSAGTSKRRSSSSASAAHKSWTTKVKYVMGGFLLLASLIMFTGILFTNRRRRKALLQRKFRQSSRRDKSSSRSKRSSSKSRSSSRRSKSRGRDTRKEEDGGVMT